MLRWCLLNISTEMMFHEPNMVPFLHPGFQTWINTFASDEYLNTEGHDASVHFVAVKWLSSRF